MEARIQREIQEAQEREEELRQKYNLINNNVPETNGFETPTPEPVAAPRTSPSMTNGFDKTSTNQNTTRMFAPNPSSRGVMQKFLKMRGKLNMVSMGAKAQPQSVYNPESTFDPAKVTKGYGKNVRNGFVSAEEKMKKELQEFQQREEELRRERKKSQPDLMAALEQEEVSFKYPRSMSTSQSIEDLTDDAAPRGRLMRARSLAELCDASDEELETRGTYSLIKQFEKMNQS